MSENKKGKRPRIRKPFDPLKIVEMFFVLMILMGFLVFLAGFIPVSHSLFRDKLVTELKKAGADSCSAGKVTLTLWQGISARDLKIIKRLDQGGSYSLSVGQAAVSSNLVSLYFSLRRSADDAPMYSDDFFRFTPEYPLEAARQVVHMLAGFPELRKIAFDNCAFTIAGDTVQSTVAEGFNLNLYPEEERETTFSGTFDADFLKTSGLHLRQVKGMFTADDMRIGFERCRGRFLGGKVKGDAIIDLVEHQLAYANIDANDIDLKSYYKFMGAQQGSLAGRADLDLELHRSAMHRDSLHGTGTLVATRLVAVDLPVQKSLVMMMVVPRLAELHFRKLKTDFQIRDGRILKTEAYGSGDLLDFKAVGWFQTDGALDQKIEGVLSKEFVDELPKLVKASMEQTRDSGRSFNIRVHGTFAEPRLELDKATMRRAVGGIFENFRDGLKDMFK
jgi:hypothetical protein